MWVGIHLRLHCFEDISATKLYKFSKLVSAGMETKVSGSIEDSWSSKFDCCEI